MPEEGKPARRGGSCGRPSLRAGSVSYTHLVFSTSQIYELVWNDPSLGSENTVAVHIRHLREKLEIDPANPRYIKVVWGLGYKMEKV